MNIMLIIKWFLLAIFLIVVAQFTFISCKQCSESSKSHELIVNFDYSKLRKDTILIAERIDFTAPLNPSNFFVINDSLVFVLSWTNDLPFSVEVYNYKTGTFITSFAKRGKGPNEYLGCMLQYKSHQKIFTLIDVIKKTVSICHIDSALLHGENYKPIQIKVPNFIGNDVEVLNEQFIIFHNSYYMHNNIFNQGVEMLMKFDILNNDHQTMENDSRFKYFTWNVSSSKMAINPSRDKIFAFCQYDNLIKTFDIELNPLITYMGPNAFKPEYIIENNRDVKFANISDTYLRCFYNEKHIYFIYNGYFNNDRSVSELLPNEVHKFTWEGEFIERYKLDSYLCTIYVNKEEDEIIGTTYDGSYSKYPGLVKYKLN